GCCVINLSSLGLQNQPKEASPTSLPTYHSSCTAQGLRCGHVGGKGLDRPHTARDRNRGRGVPCRIGRGALGGDDLPSSSDAQRQWCPRWNVGRGQTDGDIPSGGEDYVRGAEIAAWGSRHHLASNVGDTNEPAGRQP